jgi:hypothetical protein
VWGPEFKPQGLRKKRKIMTVQCSWRSIEFLLTRKWFWPKIYKLVVLFTRLLFNIVLLLTESSLHVAELERLRIWSVVFFWLVYNVVNDKNLNLVSSKRDLMICSSWILWTLGISHSLDFLCKWFYQHKFLINLEFLCIWHQKFSA